MRPEGCAGTALLWAETQQLRCVWTRSQQMRGLSGVGQKGSFGIGCPSRQLLPLVTPHHRVVQISDVWLGCSCNVWVCLCFGLLLLVLFVSKIIACVMLVIFLQITFVSEQWVNPFHALYQNPDPSPNIEGGRLWVFAALISTEILL